MKYLKFILASFAIAIVFWGCSSSSEPSKPDFSRYLPTKVGSYWVYEYYDVDENGNKDPESMTIDSMYVVGPTTKGGKNCTEYKTNSGGDESSSYMYIEGSKLYSYATALSTELLPLPVDQWFIMADFEGTTWVILKDTTISGLEVPDFPGVKIDVTLGVTGAKGGTKSITVGSQTFTAQEFTMNLKIVGKMAGLEIVNFTKVIKNYFVQDIGLIQASSDANKVNILGMGEMVVPGYLQTLIKYNIAK
ncbi:MAG: hypothetical protein N2319_11970 [Candidatus Kapabacteria bacterium]|nr:hypothetical protein [Candidatus Kapabacteria bacterium]